MSGFTGSEARDFLRLTTGSKNICEAEVRIDSRGRISLPAFLRRNYFLEKGCKVRLLFDLEKDFVILNFGQCGVTGSTRGCGPLSPDSREAGRPEATGKSRLSGFSGTDPVKSKGGVGDG